MEIFLRAWVLTVIIETAALFFVLRCLYKISASHVSNKRLLFLGIFCSSVTLPFVWFVFPLVIKSYFFFLVVAEAFAVITEAWIYSMFLQLNYRKVLLVSLICNAISFLIGFVYL